MSAQKTFCVTVRPKLGICDKRVKMYHDWAMKQDGCYGVLEGEGIERHLHLQLFFKEPRTKGDVNKAIQRIYERLDVEPNEIRVLRQGTKFAYDMNFIETYLQKDDDSVVVCDKIPDDTRSYFPTEEQQARIRSASSATDKYYYDLSVKCSDFIKDKYVCGLQDICQVQHYFGWAMYKERNMRVISDPRILGRTIRSLYRYMRRGEFALWDDAERKIVYEYYERLLTEPLSLD